MAKSVSIRIIVAMAAIAAGTIHAAAADRQLVGACVCKKGGSTLATYSASACVPNTHEGCTTVKVACVRENTADCTRMGGTISQSTNRCTGYEDKC